MVAACKCHCRDGCPGDRVQSLHRRDARRARPAAQMTAVENQDIARADTQPLLAIRELAVDFRIDDKSTLQAVTGVSFDVPLNQTVALVGESGSGKSVTALAIVGLLPKENAAVRAPST